MFCKILYVRLFFANKYYKVILTLRYERLALSKGRKGVLFMVANDVIFRLVEMLMAEKDKNCELRLTQLQQNKQTDYETSKDYK